METPTPSPDEKRELLISYTVILCLQRWFLHSTVKTIGDMSSDSSAPTLKLEKDVAGEEKFPAVVNGFANALSMSILKTVTCPIQRVSHMRAIGNQNSAVDIFKAILQEEKGVRSLWNGNLTSIMMRFPQAGSQYVVYAELKGSFLAGDENMSPVMQKFFSKCIAGGIGAAVGVTIAFPIDTLRSRLMSGNQQYVAIVPTVKHIYNDAGILGFYKGLGAALCQKIPELLIGFAVYETVFYEMRNNRGYSSTEATIAGGMSAGLCSLTVAHPLDVCKRRMQMDGTGVHDRVKYKNMGHCLVGLYRTGGIKALYAGVHIEAMRQVPQVTAHWFLFQYLRERMTVQYKNAGYA